MNITLLTVGKIKENYFSDAIKEYVKRLGKYCKLTIVEVADEKTPDKASMSEETKIKEKEAERLIKYIREDSYVISLAIEGKKYDSVSFSEKLEALMVQGKSNLVFIIGGSLGLHDKIMVRSDETISFSDMTFPHQLIRIILLEQLYRGFRIMKGEPYHK